MGFSHPATSPLLVFTQVKLIPEFLESCGCLLTARDTGVIKIELLASSCWESTSQVVFSLKSTDFPLFASTLFFLQLIWPILFFLKEVILLFKKGGNQKSTIRILI